MTTHKTIEDTWRSRYEYGLGLKDEANFSEHRIIFEKHDNKWVGTSLPNEEGSVVTITLAESGSEFAGAWQEKTSPTGHYKGRIFKGLILFVLSEDGNTLTGKWLGAGSGRVKSGVWKLTRV
jgi:hypothetical protein